MFIYLLLHNLPENRNHRWFKCRDFKEETTYRDKDGITAPKGIVVKFKETQQLLEAISILTDTERKQCY